MSVAKKLGFTALIGGAILGRSAIGATYDRTIKSATDAHIRYVGGAFLVGVSALVLNFIFMMNEAHGAQMFLFGAIVLASLYYMIAPRLAVPAIGVAAAARAGEAGGSSKIALFVGGVKDVANTVGVVLFWIGVYIVVTMIAPWFLVWEFCLFVHMFALMVLMLLMSGKVSVSPVIYERAFKITLGIIVAAVLAMAMGRHHILPLWAEFSASKTSRVEAKLNASSIKTADEAAADWIAANVKVNDRGEQVVIVADKVTGKPKAVAAQPYIDREKQRRNDTIRTVTGKKVNAGDTATASKHGYLSYGYWEAKTHEYSKDWGVPLSVAAIFVIALVLAHFIPLIWGGKKLFGKSDAVETKTDAKKASTTGKEWQKGFVVALLIVGALAFIGYSYMESKKTGRPQEAGQTPAGAPVAGRAIMPSEESGDWMANYRDVNNHEEYRLPQDAWHGKAVPLLEGSYVAKVASITLVFNPKDPSTNLYLSGGECGVGRTGIPWQCVGYWKTGTEAGHYRLEQEMDPRTFHVALYSRKTSIRAGAQPIKEIRFVRNH